MSLTVVKGLQSEIFVPVTPPPVWAPVKKELKDMTIALATAAGVHHKEQKRFNLAGDFTWRKITDKMPSDELMVSHGGYDNSDVNKDINCMFPIDRIHELAKEGFIKACAPVHAGFMGGGGNQEKFKHETGPAIAKMFVEEGVDAVLVQRAIEAAGIPTIIIAALPPVVRQTGTPRAVAPRVPMGANAGEPHNVEMQTGIVKATLEQLVKLDTPGKVVPLPFEYVAKV